jgi:UDP:flavonoid glycosyltransferase YjiC (YdhE family)
MPQGRDQKDVALRVQRLGAGVRLRKREPPDGIARAVNQVLALPGYRRAAERFAITLEAEREHWPSAADEVEGLLRDRA